MTQHIIALSGGKDSVCLALALREREPRQYRYVYTPTGNELPAFHAHIQHLEGLLSQKIERLGDHTLEGVIAKHKAIPNFRMRFCTRDIKIEPMLRLLRAIKGNAIMYVGLRADEKTREGLVSSDVEMRFPLREWGWGLQEVLEFNACHGVRIPERTDCAWCFFQTIGEWHQLWRDYPDLYQAAVDIEKQYGHTFRSRSRDTWPARLDALANEFARGRAIPKRKTKQSLACAWCSR